jgi:N-acetylglucosamine kinase-like BadF-type ATPase
VNREPLLRLPAAIVRPRATGEPRHVLGIDGGASKTVAAVLDLRTHDLQLARGGPSNEDSIGATAAVAALLDAADGALRAAGVTQRELAAGVVAVAGTDTQAIAEHLRSARAEPWTVVNDSIAAWAAATGVGPGVAVVSGTGSSVFGVGPDGRSWRAGGWGHVLGDEGSGYWLGIESIKATLRDRDASGPPTSLSELARRFFGVGAVEALAPLFYAEPPSKDEVAAFAAHVAQAAVAGDAVARQLYERAAAELARRIDAVVAETGLGGACAQGAGASQFPVGLIGSAFKAGAVFVDPLARAVEDFAPAARVETVRMAPVGGSLLLAARACGRAGEVDRDELAALIDASASAD